MLARWLSMAPDATNSDDPRRILIDLLLQRRPAGGGYAPYPGEPSRSDATAWSLAALGQAFPPPTGPDPDTAFLLSLQQPDGRFVLLAEKPEDCWVTAPALLALCPRPQFAAQTATAVTFLLQHPGETAELMPEVFGHDTRLHGWPWILGTHSWVDSTALVLLALRACGRQQEPLFQEAVRLLLDRQLPTGGWNVGVKYIYQTLSRPSLESTCIALAALTGIVAAESLAPSFAYLQSALADCMTPLGFSWAVLARPSLFGAASVAQRLLHFANNPAPLPALPTEWLAVMLLALDAASGSPPPWSAPATP